MVVALVSGMHNQDKHVSGMLGILYLKYYNFQVCNLQLFYLVGGCHRFWLLM
jgi:hypothetical protein